MENINNNAFPEVLPEHPHRGLYILISILVFVAIAGVVVSYQLKKFNTTEFTNVNTNIDQNSNSQLKAKLTDMSNAMKDAGAGQVTLTDAELKKIADNMNKSKKK